MRNNKNKFNNKNKPVCEYKNSKEKSRSVSIKWILHNCNSAPCIFSKRITARTGMKWRICGKLASFSFIRLQTRSRAEMGATSARSSRRKPKEGSTPLPRRRGQYNRFPELSGPLIPFLSPFFSLRYMPFFILSFSFRPTCRWSALFTSGFLITRSS